MKEEIIEIIESYIRNAKDNETAWILEDLLNDVKEVLEEEENDV